MADFTGQEDPYLAFINAGLAPYLEDAPVPPVPSDPLALTEYGLPSVGSQLPPPPPPPPPPVQRFGGQPPIEETAAPIPAAAPGPKVADLVDVTQEPGSIAPAPEPPNPWATLEPDAPHDPWALQPDMRAAGRAFNDAVRPFDETGKQVWLDTEDEDKVAAALADDPVALAKYRGAKMGELATEAANRRAKAIAEDTALHEANVKARAEAKAHADAKAAQVDQEAQQLSADGGFWASRTFGQELAGALSIILGGLHSSAKNGRNIGVEAINGAIDRHISAQRAKLADRRSAVGAMYARLGDDFATAEGIRAAGWKLTEQRLLSEMQQFDPRSSRVMTIANDVAQARAQQAAALARVREAEEKRLNHQIEIDLKKQAEARAQRAQAETERNNREQTKTANWKIAVDQKQGEKRLAFDEKKLKADIDIEANKLEAAGKKDEAQVWRERGISGLEAPRLDEKGKPVLDQATGKYVTENKPLLNKDGTRWIPTGSPEAVNKLRNHKIAADKLVDILDQVDALGPEFLSNTANSAKLQELKQLWADAKLVVKDSKELGVIAGPDMDLIEDFLGTGDPTRYKDSAAGRASARRRVVSGMQSEMKAHGYDGESYEPPNVYERKAPTGEGEYKRRLEEDEAHSYDMNGKLTNPPGPRDPRTGGSIFE